VYSLLQTYRYYLAKKNKTKLKWNYWMHPNTEENTLETTKCICFLYYVSYKLLSLVVIGKRKIFNNLCNCPLLLFFSVLCFTLIKHLVDVYKG
jgi:hypothetical protein